MRRALSLVGYGIVAVLFFASFHTESIAYFCVSWKLAHEDPLLRVKPGPLPTLVRSTAVDQALSYFHINFKTPWKKVVSVKQSSFFSRVQFEDGQFVLVFDPAKRPNRVQTSKAAALSMGRDITSLYGSDVMGSNYNFLTAVLYLTPAEVSIFSGWNKFVRGTIFIQLKHFEVFGAQTGLYYFATDKLRGFQKGDPQRSNLITVDAFDEGDHEYEVWFGQTTGTHGTISQEDINAILDSIQMDDQPRVTTQRPSRRNCTLETLRLFL